MIISVVNHKGGTGKTTTCVNLGSALQKLNKSVLLVDLDPQGNLSFSMGIHESDKNLTDTFLHQTSIAEAKTTKNDIDVVPCDISLADVELNIQNQENRHEILKEALSTISKHYDYIIIDCPPSLSLLTINALNCSKEILIPLQLEVLSIKGLDQILETVRKISKNINPQINILGVVPVMVDKRKNLNNEVLDFIKSNFEINVFNSSIRTNVKASEAPSFGKSVIDYAPRSNSALDYMKLAEEFLQKTI